MSRYASDGSINVTVVDGNTFVGECAADGSMNVVIQNGNTFTGLIHPSGARNAVVTGDAYASPRHQSGAMNIFELNTGDYAPTPIWNVPIPASPAGFSFLLGQDGAYLLGADSANLLGAS